MQSDIFDTSDVSDLPEELAAWINGRRVVTPGSIYLGLFRLAGRPLAKDEVAVGLYRKHGRMASSQTVARMLHNMTKRGVLVHVGHSLYALPDAV